jgi:hypothetical protein
MGSEDDAADNNGDMTIDFALDGTKQVVSGCYRFNMKDLNKDCNFSAVEEISPDQPYDFGYSNGQNGVFFYFTDWDMIFDADKDRLSIDVTYEQVNGKKVDAFWICVTPGPAPHTTTAPSSTSTARTAPRRRSPSINTSPRSVKAPGRPRGTAWSPPPAPASMPPTCSA